MDNRVKTGYGTYTSKLSIANIGQYNLEASASGDRSAKLIKHMKQSADQQMQDSKSTHPSKLNLHMQNNYTETSKRLQNGDLVRAKTPPELKNNFTWNQPFKPKMQESIVPSSQTQVTQNTADWNRRKREFNKERSSNAEVDRIMSGDNSQVPTGTKYPLFPQKASHQSLLGIDNKLVGMSAEVQAPPVRVKNKWLGDNLGWEGNRGLKATRPEFEDGKAMPWPDKYGR